jgi:hypothetical protein
MFSALFYSLQVNENYTLISAHTKDGGIAMGIEKLQIEQSEISKIDVGSGLSLEEWANLVHPQSDGYVTVATKNAAGEWTEKSYPSSIWVEKLVQHKDLSCYVSVNSFFIPKRNNSNARQINAFYVDLDHYKEFLSQEDVLAAINFLVKTERLPEPTMIIDSGRGLYAIWLIESVPAKFVSVQKLYSHIEKYLIDVLKDFGSDPQASDIARVLKAPSTYHHVTGKMVEVLQYNANRYTMRFMQQWFNENAYTDYDEEEIKKRKTAKKPKNKGLQYLYNFYSLAIARSEDLTKLCYLRDYEMSGYRNTLIHIYAYQMFLIHNNYHIVRSKVVDLNDKLTDPIPTPDLVSVVKTCLRAYEEHREDPTKGYNYKNETIINKLSITLDEQRQMNTLISKEVKYERKNIKRQEDRRKDGLTTRERTLKENVEKVSELLKQGLKQKEIAEKLGLTKGRVSQLVKALKKV